MPKQREPAASARGGLTKDSGGVLLSRAENDAVPSALKGFTAVFGMGTGGSTPLSPPGSFGRDTRGHGR